MTSETASTPESEVSHPCRDDSPMRHRLAGLARGPPHLGDEKDRVAARSLNT